MPFAKYCIKTLRKMIINILKHLLSPIYPANEMQQRESV